VLRSQTRDSQEQAQEQRSELQRQLSSVLGQQDRLVNPRLNEEIDADTFAKKQTELRDREAALKPTWKRSIDRTTKSLIWRSKRLNFRKHFASNGLPLITLQNVASSKSSV